MAYNYSNPFQSTSAHSRSTFAAASGTVGYQILFGGLPLDVTEKDIRDLLLNEPLGLPASTTSVRALHSSTGQFLGLALVQVAHEVDAERIRREYSGQTIDATFRLTVQHILPPTQPPPAASVTPFLSKTVAAKPAPKPAAKPAPSEKASKQAKELSIKPPGLELLSRLAKPGQAKQLTPKEKQLALLAKQKANLKAAGSPGSGLLSRLNVPKTKAKRVSTGNDKTARAKKSMAMDVDKEKPTKKEKLRPKTQEELDEEMRAYERARRFAA